MNTRTKKIIGWILTALIGFAFIASAAMKLTGGEAAAKSAAVFGLTADTLKLIGVVEILSVLLFVIPRTGLLGTLLLAAYLGGAIATHIEHQQPAFAPIILQCIVWITAVIRFPELSQRLFGRTN